MKNRLFLAFAVTLIFISNSVVFGQKRDLKLQEKLELLTASFEGEVGIYVINLKTNRVASINQKETFPTASMVKVPIMVGVFEKITKGELKYDSVLTYSEAIKYDDGITGSLKDGSKVPLAEVIWLMETLSDNTASLWLQGIVGGENINNLMDSLNLNSIKVNSRTPGRKSDWEKYGWGQTNPEDMAMLLVKIRNQGMFSKAASNRMYRTLGNQFWDGEGLSQIPESVKFACKTGAVDASRSEVALIHAPHGEYAYCVVTKNQKDISWERGNAGYELIRNVAAVLWRHFEPKSAWKPTKDYDKWY
ncbi:serine hydrolase [Lacihabitans lacunae]|uniref:Serine hydrolase n=1 Tax=Lacihabitans lacunae TaxID=1028214 RepID=A0ABV7YR61_9BACT